MKTPHSGSSREVFQFYSRSSDPYNTIYNIAVILTFNSIVDHPERENNKRLVNKYMTFNSIVDHPIATLIVRSRFLIFAFNSIVDHLAREHVVMIGPPGTAFNSIVDHQPEKGLYTGKILVYYLSIL